MNKEEQLKFIEDNYPLYTNHKSNRRIRHDFFKNIQTEIQAYLLGLYAADGSVDEKRKTFRFHLQEKDSELVYLYKDIISPDARLFSIKPNQTTIIKTRNREIRNNGSIGVDITSTILVTDLIDLGIGYRKTYKNLSIPKIPKHLIRHFFRGYFDGDGSITGHRVDADLKTNRKERFRRYFTIDSKTDGLLLEFKDFLLENEIKINVQYLKRDDMWRICTSSKIQIEKLFKLLYNDSYFYLSRKFEKFNYYVNTEVNQLITDHRNAQILSDNESNNISTSAEHPK